MNKIKVTRFEATDYLDSEEAIAGYLNATIEANDPELLLAAITDVAKAYVYLKGFVRTLH